MIERQPALAFDTYVSRDYCNHGHLSTGGQRDCMGFDETRVRWLRNYGQPLKPGELVEVPYMATVNGEMVTMYGEGVDIFRVHNGKLTDHWDASPPARITLKAHAPGFADWVMGERTGKPPSNGTAEPGAGSGMLVDDRVFTAVDVGPLTPYGETAREMAAKRVPFARNYMSMIQGKSKAAIEKYVSPEFCDHSHMMTRGRKDCATRAELIASPMGNRAAAKLGDRIEMPYMATVDGEMVTMYGAGVDIFRVKDGLITDHWDASPPAAVTVREHGPEVVERMMKVLAGELPVGIGPGPGSTTASPAAATPATGTNPR
jgi:predicted SnoaL-like aldol condensation-catalyzing enzyme